MTCSDLIFRVQSLGVLEISHSNLFGVFTMARSARFEGVRLAHVVVLLAKYGIKMTRDILAAPLTQFGKPHKVGSLRDKKLFPEPESVSMPCLWAIGVKHEVQLSRGRKDITKGLSKKQRQYVGRLVKNFGVVQACKTLKDSSRDKGIFPSPLSITPPTASKIAKSVGVELTRGRRAAKVVNQSVKKVVQSKKVAKKSKKAA